MRLLYAAATAAPAFAPGLAEPARSASDTEDLPAAGLRLRFAAPFRTPNDPIAGFRRHAAGRARVISLLAPAVAPAL